MEERVFADEFRKGFWQEEDFLTFLERREENSEWGKVRSSEIILSKKDIRFLVCLRKN